MQALYIHIIHLAKIYELTTGCELVRDQGDATSETMCALSLYTSCGKDQNEISAVQDYRYYDKHREQLRKLKPHSDCGLSPTTDEETEMGTQKSL